jgi:hypothetical protein
MAGCADKSVIKYNSFIVGTRQSLPPQKFAVFAPSTKLFYFYFKIMNYQNKFSIYCDATRLVIEMEDAVRDFPRYHKYTLGSEMRTIAYDLLTVISYHCHC